MGFGNYGRIGGVEKGMTWGGIERLRGRNIVVCKWVLHIKNDVAGKIKHYKA